jgi:hypothetical protein
MLRLLLKSAWISSFARNEDAGLRSRCDIKRIQVDTVASWTGLLFELSQDESRSRVTPTANINNTSWCICGVRREADPAGTHSRDNTEIFLTDFAMCKSYCIVACHFLSNMDRYLSINTRESRGTCCLQFDTWASNYPKRKCAFIMQLLGFRSRFLARFITPLVNIVLAFLYLQLRSRNAFSNEAAVKINGPLSWSSECRDQSRLFA